MPGRSIARAALVLALASGNGANAARAQDASRLPAASHAVIGLKGGLNTARFALSSRGHQSRSESLTLPTGGVFVEYGWGRRLAMRAEALFSRKGEMVVYDSDRFREESVDYLEFPLLLVVSLPTPVSVRPVLSAGPVLALCDVWNVRCGSGHRADFGLAAGGGVDVALGSLRVSYEGRYTHGLYDIEHSRSSEKRSRVWAFTAGLGYRWR